METRVLPEKLNDGTYDYNIVTQEKDLGHGIKQIALYERDPKDPEYQFTPDLGFLLGQNTVPYMHKIMR